MIAFGPVPSRRLGRSLGINNIPPKICTYSCVYCQLGRTISMCNEPRIFYRPEQIQEEVLNKVEQVRKIGEPIDYLSFVPDGEPTLDIQLGSAIDLLKIAGIRIAAISNASLIWHADVRKNLAKADWVSLKLDATEEQVWRKINRPHGALKLDAILDGMVEFARSYQGELVTETMLIKGINDQPNVIEKIADFLPRLQPSKAYLTLPTRPPAEHWVRPPETPEMKMAYQILSERVGRVEYLMDCESSAFVLTGSIEEDLLSITAVHPIREDALQELLRKEGLDWSIVQDLIDRRQLLEVDYAGKKFFVKRLT
jgi:wyosine [tRNA(Phe)-imidazoG37] synthetase (radical SAM superfamily)